ncbi:MAG TPA: methyltransferase domain-containing protein [Ktedonobacterales bacterium]|nr:methyltransferase domain-containing protein [Ktedonobacterales bacterium]
MPWFSFLRRKRASTEASSGKGRLEALGDRLHMADAPYVLPADDQEINRLDFQHYMLRHTLRGNYAAPIVNPQSILDVGSGTGRWALEMATLFPHTNVIGVDLNPPTMENTAGAVPENFAFTPGNILEGLKFADGSFDLVHMRLLLFAIPEARWPDVVRELARVTRPGGWVELVETGPQQRGGPAMDKIVEWVTEASLKRGINPLLGPRISQFLTMAGLTNVVSRSIALPVGAYGGRVGRLAETDVFGVVGGVKGLVTSMGIATPEAYDGAMAQARADLATHQCVLPFYIAYAQRPA